MFYQYMTLYAKSNPEWPPKMLHRSDRFHLSMLSRGAVSTRERKSFKASRGSAEKRPGCVGSWGDPRVQG